MKDIVIRILDNGYTIEYHADDEQGNDKLHQEVIAKKTDLKAKLLEVFK